MTNAISKLDELQQFGIIPQIYSLVYPETAAVRARLYADPAMLQSHEKAYESRHSDDVDAFLTHYRRWIAPVATVEDTHYPFAYVANGSTEAIREVIAQSVIENLLRDRTSNIHIFDGEYQGYAAYVEGYAGAHSDQISLQRYDRASVDRLFADLKPGSRVMLSQPSGIDGNYWDYFDEFISRITSDYPFVEVDVDIAYAGATTTLKRIDLSSPNIGHVFFSLSKVFGVYRDRIGGVFSRRAIPGLFGNKWFNNVFSLEMGRRLMQGYAPCELPQYYKGFQHTAAARISTILGETVHSSDVLLMANQSNRSDHAELFRTYGRGYGMRYCLTPCIDQMIKSLNNG